MLLNVSNHAYNTWTKRQRETAIKQYGKIEDLPFPDVPPSADMEEIRVLVDTYEDRIKKYDLKAVHVMGELTFCHALVNRLQVNEIVCVASTTKRKAYKDKKGNFIRQFEFVQFREYLSD